MSIQTTGAGLRALRFVRLAVWCAAILAIWGCAPMPLTKKPAENPGGATPLSPSEETRLGRELKSLLASHQGQSGFHLLVSGMDAFLARALMIDAAERTIDLQYYIVENDTTTQLLFNRLLRAADRGVHIRMLIDDTNARGVGLAELSAHPCIQVRTFNPMQSRFFGTPGLWFNFLINADVLNRRMHNKMLAVDGQAAIVGGRNLSDAYYEARPGVIFMDLDLWVVGPIMQDLGRSFDEYWKSPWATPVDRFTILPRGEAALKKLRRRLEAHEKAAEQTQYMANLKNSDLLHRLERGKLELIWAQAELAYDSPQKVNGKTTSQHVGPQIHDLSNAAIKEVVFVTPYFIPERDGMKLIADLRRRGVRVRVLTNSLMATDIVSAYVAFARYRRELLDMGVEIHELKPTAAFEASQARRMFGSKSISSLHAKSYIFDGEVVLLGSFNLDPRSKRLNTEMGLIVNSPELVRQIGELVQEGMKPRNSYRVVLEKPPGGGTAREVWITEDKDGREARFYREPGKGLRAHISQGLLRVFPLEGLL